MIHAFTLKACRLSTEMALVFLTEATIALISCHTDLWASLIICLCCVGVGGHLPCSWKWAAHGHCRGFCWLCKPAGYAVGSQRGRCLLFAVSRPYFLVSHISAVHIFKFGCPLQIEVKGSLQLAPLENFLEDLKGSRSRTLTVGLIRCHPGASEAELASMTEVNTLT